MQRYAEIYVTEHIFVFRKEGPLPAGVRALGKWLGNGASSRTALQIRRKVQKLFRITVKTHFWPIDRNVPSRPVEEGSADIVVRAYATVKTRTMASFIK